MADAPVKQEPPAQKEAERKEREEKKANELSSNPNEAVQKSIAKSSSDEVKPTPG